jgi:hypothetical protein
MPRAISPHTARKIPNPVPGLLLGLPTRWLNTANSNNTMAETTPKTICDQKLIHPISRNWLAIASSDVEGDFALDLSNIFISGSHLLNRNLLLSNENS